MSFLTNEFALAKLLDGTPEYLEDETARIYSINGALRNNIGIDILISEYESQVFMTIFYKNLRCPFIHHKFMGVENFSLDLKHEKFCFLTKSGGSVECSVNPVCSVLMQGIFCFPKGANLQKLKFDKIDLIEIFGVLPKEDSQANICEFTTQKNSLGFSLRFSLFLNENKIRVISMYDKSYNPVYDVIIENVSKVEVNKNVISILLGDEKRIALYYYDVFYLETFEE